MAKPKDFFHSKKIVIIAVAALVLIAAGIAVYFAACAAPGVAPADPAEKSSMAALGGEGSSEEKTETSSADIVLSDTESTASADESEAVTGGESSRPLQPVSSTASQTATGTTNNAGTDTSPASSHVHTWVNHTVQVWVPNIVTVVEQPEQTISGARFYTMHESGEYVADGPTYWFENGFTTDDLKEIIKEGLQNADSNGLYNGVYYGNYQNVTKTIPAVTHEEDQGHYEEKTDYQYCGGCGQRK